MFFKSVTAYLNAGHHDWAVKNIFNSRCPKTVILAFLKQNPLKASPFQHPDVFVVLVVLLTRHVA